MEKVFSEVIPCVVFVGYCTVRVQGGYKQTFGYHFSNSIMVMIYFRNKVLKVVVVRKDMLMRSGGKFSDSIFEKCYTNFRGDERLVV